MHGFGDLEAVIMHRVWDHADPVTVRELFDELQQERVIAYTTVMTTMDNLHRKGWLTRVKEGKAYRYTATASRRTTVRNTSDSSPSIWATKWLSTAWGSPPPSSASRISRALYSSRLAVAVYR